MCLCYVSEVVCLKTCKRHCFDAIKSSCPWPKNNPYEVTIYQQQFNWIAHDIEDNTMMSLYYITLLITHDNKRKQWWVVDIWHWITPLLKVFMSKTDCQLIMKDISWPMRGHTTKLWTIRSWYYKGCFCTMYNSRDWRVDVGITEWLSGPWMTPGIWSDHVWCEHVTVTKSQSINTSGINYINPLRSEDLGFNRE